MAFFAFLAAICIAAPVLAETPVEEPEAADPQELQRDESLETPQAEAAREDSEFAYADLTAGGEASLLRDVFAQQLEAIDADPARALADVTIERLDSPTEALVVLDGERALLESEVPLRAPEEDGDLHKVELGLEETPTGYEPANPLVSLVLPDSAQDPIGIGDEGLALTPVGTADAPAAPIGEEDLLLPGAHEDTSLLLSPIAGGVEISAMLASRNSPQALAFDVTLPQGASLRAEESGGAAVIGADGGLIATIGAPLALDAQGTEVPATLAVEGHTLSILVPHRDLDVAYPLFVDPPVDELWPGFADTSKLGYWHWAWAGVAGAEDYIGRTSCIVTCWGNGLYVRARSNFTYPAGSWGRWWFTPQGSTTYMRRVVLGPINYDTHGCTANEPHGYIGVWNDYSGWVVRNNAFPSGWAASVDVPNLPPGSRTVFVGIHADAQSNLNCGRDYRLGGASLYLDDPERPTAHATSGYPTGWVKSGVSFTINGPASDPGLGLKKATLSPKQTVSHAKELSCDGHYANQCPANHTFQFPIGSGSFDEGEKQVQFSVQDILDKPSDTYTWMMKVDRTPPEIELAGQLAQATDETEGDGQDEKDSPLRLPVYNLTVNATDGVLNPTDGGQKRSGVKKIQVFIDDRATPEQTWEASSCAAGNCPLNKVFTLKLNELSAGAQHYLRVLATDFAGNVPRERKIEFEYIPATGMKDEYVMQYFPLPDGSGNEAEEEHPKRPELAVNLVSGNLLYRQQDVDVSGASADLELELFYNSLLPEQESTEWGRGWTLAQTPELEIESPAPSEPPTEALVMDETAAVESEIDLPAGVGEEKFDKRLQATVKKEPGGLYALSDESGETAETVTFDSSGRAQELTNGTAATVEYDYEGGRLAAIEIEDPGTANAAPGSIEEDEASPPLAFKETENFAAPGAADGQLQNPADAATDPQGNLWVLDRGNSRVQKFSPSGQFLAKFGSPGTGEGQLNSPSALALDAEGNILIAENSRVQKLSPSGQFLAKFGSAGGANGQFVIPSGIAVGVDGTIWVSDYTRVQRFTAAGQFIERVGASGAGYLLRPQSLAVNPSSGEVFVADPELDLVKVYDKEGEFLRQFGQSGTAPGQLAAPTEVDVDSEGLLWVGDEMTDRVQVFTAHGDYVAGFGATGSGAGQLKLEERTGIAAGMGRVWVADSGNGRVAEWLGGNYEPSAEAVLVEDDPRLEVAVSEGLVDTVEVDAEEGGTIDYQHSGDLLSAVDGPDGEAQFSYDTAGRMTKVTLPNGTYGEIAYEATYGQVKSVTVAVEGKNPKTTYFSWSHEPRRTIVTPPDAPATTYDIAGDGSILKWWNAKEPPVFDDIGGTLYDPNNRETSTPIPTGTHNLVIQAHDEEGIASIQVIANNNQLVDERTCDYDPAEPTKCLTETNEWVTETGNWPPGIVYLEIIATDRLGEAGSQRFWVNIPYTPPPDPEEEEPPRFSDVLRFREDFGLDLDLKGEELAINDRVFETIGDWHNPMTPAGAVARASMEKWGVPLRQADVAELEYREWYLNLNAPLIEEWAGANRPNTFAGYYIDHRGGGTMYVGFTSDQEGALAGIKQQVPVGAPDRLAVYPQTPTVARASLDSTLAGVEALWDSDPVLREAIMSSGIDEADNTVEVSGTDVSLIDSRLRAVLGQQAPLRVIYEPEGGEFAGRNHTTGRIRAGDRLLGRKNEEYTVCDAGFGAWDILGTKPNGEVERAPFVLTAGHCAPVGRLFFRQDTGGLVDPEKLQKIGHSARTGLPEGGQEYETDGSAIKLNGSGLMPYYIFLNGQNPKPVGPASAPRTGEILCFSGVATNKRTCGEFVGVRRRNAGNPGKQLFLITRFAGIPGDSGAPVWSPRTGRAVGLVSGGPKVPGLYKDWVTPLVAPRRQDPSKVPGILNAPGMKSLHLAVPGD